MKTSFRYFYRTIQIHSREIARVALSLSTISSYEVFDSQTHPCIQNENFTYENCRMYQESDVALVSSLVCFRNGIKTVPPVPGRASADFLFVDAIAKFNPELGEIAALRDGPII